MLTLDEILLLATGNANTVRAHTNAIANIVPTLPVVAKPREGATVEEDAEYVRQQLYDIIEKGNIALKDLTKMASEYPSSRAYEVIAALLKSLADNTDKLMKLHKDRKEATGQALPTTMNVNNAVFVGTTKDFIKLVHNTTPQLEVIDVEAEEVPIEVKKS